jgi:cell division protein FtsQ
VIALLLVAALGAGGWFGYPYLWNFLCGISHFKVTRITFTGIKSVKESELRTLLPQVGGVNLFALNFPDLEKRLQTHPWVKSAQLTRRLPDKLSINITERTPVALLSRQGLWALDDQAVAMPFEAARGELDLPLVVADSGQTPEAGSALVEEPLASLLPKIDALHRRAPNLWATISEISWDDRGQLEIYAFGNPARIMVGDSPTWRQMLNFYTFVVYQGRRNGLDDIAFMDLRFPGQVVVRRNPAPTDSTAKPQS